MAKPQLLEDVGKVSELKTDNKTVVGGINEVLEKEKANEEQISNMKDGTKDGSLQKQINVLSGLIGNFKIYGSFASIDASFDNTTDIATICSKMQGKSLALLDVGNNTSLYPSNYGFVTIHKINSSRCRLIFTSHINTIFAFGSWHSTQGFTGWNQLYTATQIDSMIAAINA